MNISQRASTAGSMLLAVSSLLGCEAVSTALAETLKGDDKRETSSRREEERDRGSSGKAAPARAGGPGRFTYAYPESANTRHAAVREGFRDLKLLEGLTEELNATVMIPRDLQVRFETCDKLNAWYTSDEPAIVFCYDLLEHAVETYQARIPDAKQREVAIAGFVMFVMMHELGHALVNELKLPVTGRQEDAVDQLATLVLLATEDDDRAVGALAGASYFAITGSEGVATGNLPFWDEHSLGPQRFYDTACLVYGSNPERNAEVVTSGLLPPSRAERCAREYAQTNDAWRAMLRPHLRDEKRFWD
jgi:hypothetical protein